MTTRRNSKSPETGQPLPSLFYVLLVGTTSRTLKKPLVEARVSSTLRGQGATEKEAISDLLLRIRSRPGVEGPVNASRLRVWRSLWQPPAASTISYLSEE